MSSIPCTEIDSLESMLISNIPLGMPKLDIASVTKLDNFFAQSHIKINKMTDGKSTKVHLTNLMRNSRVEEIARMLGGIKVTKRTREHAAEMLKIKG